MMSLLGIFLGCLLDPIALVVAFLIILSTNKKYIILIAAAITATLSELLLFQYQVTHQFNLFVFTIRFFACMALSAFSYWLYWSVIKKRNNKFKK